MKSIAVLTESSRRCAFGETIRENIIEVFGNIVTINNYYFSELNEGDIIEEDVILVMVEEQLILARKYTIDPKKILVIRRTIKTTNVYKLLQIPKGTNVLVVNEDRESTLQTVELLYQIGVKQLNLIPYNNTENQNKTIKIAVTPGQQAYVPDYIENVIDVGIRCMDADTIITIIEKLKIDNSLVSKNVINYFNKIVDMSTGLKSQYVDFYIQNEQFNKVMVNSNEGILITDKDYTISYYNKKLIEMLDIRTNSINRNLQDIIDDVGYRFLIKENLNQELLNLKKDYTLVTKSPLVYFGEVGGYCYNFHTATYIKQLQQNMSIQLRKSGLIARYSFADIRYKSKIMGKCIEISKKVSKNNSTILITGESGTGKELIAQSIHNYSDRCNNPFVPINCAALPESLLESELFGYESGAYTGANKNGKVGVFELANDGTLFLDEIGDIPLNLQTKLLRVIQEKQIMRLGSERIQNVNVRIIAATNKNLKNLLNEGKFRDDLYYRISTIPIRIPPLRERKEDILELFKYFIGEKYAILSDHDKQIIFEHSWPGNVRELKNMADYFMIMNELNGEILYSEGHSDSLNKLFNIEKLYRYTNEEELTNILTSIYDYSLSQNGIGRIKLIKTLSENDIIIKESRLKNIISILKEEKFLKSYIGRQGSKITVRGIELLNWLQNKLKQSETILTIHNC